MVAVNRFRWPVFDPSEPPYPAYPENVPAFMPPTAPVMGSSAPAVFPSSFVPPTAETPPEATTYPPMGFEAPQATAGAPEATPEDDQFEQQLEQRRAEAEELQEIERETERLKADTKLLKAQNAMRKAQEEKAKIAPRESAVQTGVKQLKEKARHPTGREALSWRGRGGYVSPGQPASQGLQDYIIAGGSMEELRDIRLKAAQKMLRAPEYVADLGPSKAPEIMALHARHLERMAPIQAQIAEVRARRRQLRRELRPPTAWDILRHKERLAELKAEPEPPRYLREHGRKKDVTRLGVIDNEILETESELAAHDESEPRFFGKDKWQAQRDKITTSLDTLKAERRKTAGFGTTLDTETARQILIEAGGDKERARQIARQRGYSF